MSLIQNFVTFNRHHFSQKDITITKLCRKSQFFVTFGQKPISKDIWKIKSRNIGLIKATKNMLISSTCGSREVENVQKFHDFKGSYILWLKFLLGKTFCPA